MQAAPLHWADVVGAVESAATVNVPAAETPPAPFVAVTSCEPFVVTPVVNE
jgi:hypothetical protein